jgi:dolichol-phosphate mannosyltransferase/undecaprenyl-phosphate 4-deoxy-4-formamido-L-arabinose transferase
MLENTNNPIIYSIVIPVYNSAKMLRELHQRLVSVMEGINDPFEIIFVEDCGPDQAWKVLEEIVALDPRVTAIQLMRNFGQGSATLCGLAHVQGQFAITLDDDLQNPPEELPYMIEQLRANEELDIIIGVPKKKRHNIIRRLGSDFINRMNSYFLRKDPTLRFTSFRVMRLSVVEALLTQRVPYPAIGPMLISVTRRIANVTVKHDSRKEGRSGYTINRLIKQTLSNFIGYSMLPLRLLAVFGGIGIALSIMLSIFYLLRYLIWGSSVQGWTSLMLVLVALSGFNFFAFAVLGEYIFRIFYLESTTQQYLIRKTKMSR